MSDAAEASPAKKTKAAAKSKKPKASPTHPPISDMVNEAISTLKERGGSSVHAIKKYIQANFKVNVEKLSPFIKKYLKTAVTNGALVQTKGKGATGSFRIGGSGSTGAAKKPKAAPAAKSPKKTAAVKVAKPKKPKTASPKKKAAAAKPKKAAAPKKPKSSPVKKAKPAAAKKKPAAKKPKPVKLAAAKPKKAKASPKKAAAKKGKK